MPVSHEGGSRVCRAQERALVAFLLIAMVTAWGEAASGYPTGPAAPTTKPNILLIISDDQSWANFNRSLMPNVFSRIVDDGVLFNRAYVSSSLCCPSRSEILTGLYERHTGVDMNPTPLLHPTIVAGLQAAGYRTALEGKYLNSSPCTPRSEFTRWVCMGAGQSTYTLINPKLNIDGTWIQTSNTYATDFLANDLLSFVQTTPANQPWFAMYAPTTPHLPADDDRCFGLPVSPWRPPSYNADPAAGNLPAFMRRPPLGPTEVVGYDTTFTRMTQAISCLDNSLGTLLNGLGSRLNDTLVVYLSDNGFHFGERRRLGKWLPYEEAQRVPFAIRYPAWLQPTQSSISSALVSNIDVAPTIAEAAGISWTADGVSLGRLVRGQVSSVRFSVLIEGCQGLNYPCPGVTVANGGSFAPSFDGVVTSDKKYVEYSNGEKELYDLSSDPNEMTNQAGEPGFATVQESLASNLAALRAEPPADTTIVAGPSGPLSTRVGTFRFYSQWRAATFTCRLNKNGVNGTWSACNQGSRTLGPLAAGSYVFEVAGTNETIADSTPASRSFSITDSGPPVTIDSGPGTQQTSRTLSYSFSSATGGVTFQCRLSKLTAAGRWAPCTSPVSYSNKADGVWLFQVKAIDGGVETSPPAQDLTFIDNAAPTFTFNEGPPTFTQRGSARFAFFANEPLKGAITCKLDGVMVKECQSPYTKSGLPVGTHKFSVKGTDRLGQQGTTTYSWTIDRMPPVLSVNLPPAYTSSTSATITWSSSEAGLEQHTELHGTSCEVDGVPRFPAACASPISLTGLGEGTHHLTLEVMDRAWNVTPVQDYSWTVDTTAPVTSIVSAPPAFASSDSATFAFSSVDATPTTFQCRLDNGAWTTCSSGVSFSQLSDGAHQFAVRATDAAGNAEGVGPKVSWTVDTLAPTVTILSGPNDPTTATSASFTFSATDATAVTFTCSLDGEPAVSCTSGQSYASLPPGSHTFTVRSTDQAGNVGDPAAYSWTITA